MLGRRRAGRGTKPYFATSRRDPLPPHSDTRLCQRVGPLCEQAKVPLVCTHSLR